MNWPTPRNMPPDFSREVRSVLGLPFDVVTESDTEERIRAAIATRRRCFLSTPNLNFAIGCLSDTGFRASVIESDLSVADGWPIVFLARLIGARLPERVAGSTVFERLAASSSRPPIAVFFFGGLDGAAEAASRRLNAHARGVVCTGFAAPGLGSVEDMSTMAQIDRVNSAHADLVVVALGAKKGQAWIRHNLDRIEAPVISHLGAVVNFAAGSIKRAPRWMQRAGLEWLWRISEEPDLWRRYFDDGRSLVRVLLTRVIPLVLHQRLAASKLPAEASHSFHEGQASIRLAGAWRDADVGSLRTLFASHAASPCPISIDLTAVTHLGSSAIALLSLLYGWQMKVGAGWQVLNASSGIRRTLRLACAEYLLTRHGTHPSGM